MCKLSNIVDNDVIKIPCMVNYSQRLTPFILVDLFERTQYKTNKSSLAKKSDDVDKKYLILKELLKNILWCKDHWDWK